jgi:uncharacterized protein (DUF1800 family)
VKTAARFAKAVNLISLQTLYDGSGAPFAAVSSMSLSKQACIACNRFGLGARPGELALAADPRRWLHDQLAGDPPLLMAGAEGERLASSKEILAGVQPIVEQLRQLRQRRSPPATAASGANSGNPGNSVGANGGNADAPSQALAAVMRVPQYLRPFYQADVRARLHAAASTTRPFMERMVHFWSNHFAVSVDKIQVLGIAGAMEREAVRPHVLGKFRDMLLAVEQHPAMLLYLDNQQSVGAHSFAARLAKRAQLGINENLAREILELHTLGVDGGYQQADVTAFARVLTGWSLGGGQGLLKRGVSGEFLFRPAIHEPGAQQVVGHEYSQEDMAQGEAVLHDLAQSSATAHHIASKLVRHFISDDAHPDTVARVASAFSRSDGDLPTIYAALIDSPEAWDTPFTKFRTPQDYLFALYRALDLSDADSATRGITAFQLLGQRQFAPGSPAGWPDGNADWDGAAALMKRIELADQVGRKLGAKVDAVALGQQLWGDALSDGTRTALARAASREQALTLLLAAPEFMRR